MSVSYSDNVRPYALTMVLRCENLYVSIFDLYTEVKKMTCFDAITQTIDGSVIVAPEQLNIGEIMNEKLNYLLLQPALDDQTMYSLIDRLLDILKLPLPFYFETIILALKVVQKQSLTNIYVAAYLTEKGFETIIEVLKKGASNDELTQTASKTLCGLIGMFKKFSI